MNTLLSAAYIATMAGPVIRDGAVVFDGEVIVAVGDGKSLREEHPDAAVVDLGNAVILPGLINAHTHLELTAVGQLPKQASFVDWILALRGQLMNVRNFEGFVRKSVAAGIEQCLRFGVTAVGDITLNPAISRPILAASQIRGVSYGEVLGMAGRIGQLDARLEAAINRNQESDQLRCGIEPHAPYSLDLIGYRRCLDAARDEQIPLATHLAETADEAQFLFNHTGPFRHLWDELGSWGDGVRRHAGGPIRTMQSLGLLDYPTLLAHVNYADDSELDILSYGTASVVYCPRTHAYFEHRPHRFEDMMERGINVAVGTDSCASSPDLNLVDDLRLIHRLRPHLNPSLLWSLVTSRAAAALGAKRIGQLSPGFFADVCIFELNTSDPMVEILETATLPREVWISGKRSR